MTKDSEFFKRFFSVYKILQKGITNYRNKLYSKDSLGYS